MTSYSPESPGAIQARLAYLRLRKAALDDLILSLERYLVYELPKSPHKPAKRTPAARAGRFAGAA
jgi:hypothetical protein